jgi:multiple sugar transport system permease protein
MKRTRTLTLVGTVAAVVVIAIVVAFPMYWMLLTALQSGASLLSTKLDLLPLDDPNLDGFRTIIEDTPALTWLSNSALITIGATVLSVVVSVLAGYSLSRFRGFGHQAMGLTLLLARMIPGTLLVIPLYALFLRLGMVNNLWSLILVKTTIIVPFATWMLKAFFDGIPRELEEAAFVDGAGPLRTLRLIVLPLSGPGIVAAVTYSAVLAWGDFLYARTLLTADAKWPVTLGITSFFGDNTTQWNAIMALALIAILPMLLLFILTEKYLVSGLTSGAVKG